MGSSSVSKALARFFKSGTLAFFLGHNPMKICVSTRLTNSKISRIDIQFASSKLTTAKRGSSSGCKVDADTLLYSTKPRKQQTAENEYISKHKRARKPTKQKKVIVPLAAADIWFSRLAMAYSRWRCSFLAVARSFSAFFALANADLVDFLALTLAAVAASKAVLEASSSASSDETRALAAFRAPEFNKEERKSQAKKQRQACEDKQVLKTRFTFRGLNNFQVLDAFIVQVDESLHQVLSRK
jgi:hypothetical protein